MPKIHCKRFVRENPWKKQCPLVHRDFDRSYSCHKQYWQKQVFLFSYILQVLSISVKNTVKDRILIQSSDLNFTDLTMNFSWKSKLIYLHFALKYPDISRKFLCQKFLKGWQMKWSLYLVLCTEGCSSARSSWWQVAQRLIDCARVKSYEGWSLRFQSDQHHLTKNGQFFTFHCKNIEVAS